MLGALLSNWQDYRLLSLDKVPWSQIEDGPRLRARLARLGSASIICRQLALSSFDIRFGIIPPGSEFIALVLLEVLERDILSDPHVVDILTHLTLNHYPDQPLPEPYRRPSGAAYRYMVEALPKLGIVFDRQPHLRGPLALLMAYIPEAYALHRERLHGQGVDGILALGLLERQLSLPATVEEFLDSPDLTIRTAGALACARYPLTSKLEALLEEGLNRHQELGPTLFNDGNWEEYIKMTLLRFAGPRYQIKVLVDADWSAAGDIGYEIEERFDDNPDKNAFREVMEAFYNSRAWELPRTRMRICGLEMTREDLRSWLDSSEENPARQ